MALRGLPGKGEAVRDVWTDRSGRTLGKGILRELPLWGLEKPLRAGEAVPRECSPSDALLFSGSRGGWPWALPRPSTEVRRPLSMPPLPRR